MTQPTGKRLVTEQAQATALTGKETTTGAQAKADAAQAAAISAAATDATAKVATHTGATDPHADRAYTDTQISALKGGADPAWDTLQEIKAFIQGDESTAAALATAVAGKASQAALDALSAAVVSTIDVSNSSGDVAAVVAAITAATTSSKVSGDLRTRSGKVARITTPTTIALGYTNTQSADWSTQTPEKVKLSLDILPDAGLGSALTIKGGYGVELDINVLGGGARGTVTDAVATTRTLTGDGTMTANDTSATYTSASAPFTTADVNCPIAIPGAGASGATLYAKIVSRVSATQVILDSVAQTSVTTAAAVVGSLTFSSPNAIAAGLNVGSVVFLNGAGVAPEGVRQPLAASVRSVNSGAGTFTLSEGSWAAVTGATMDWYGVAVRLEDHLGLKLNIYGKAFQGYLLAADCADDATKRVRGGSFGRLSGQQCGGTIFWKAIEAFGSMGQLVSNGAHGRGDYFGLANDLQWTHYEGGVGSDSTPNTPNYLWFDRCGQVNNLSVSVGDRATEAAVKMNGDSNSSNANVGRFSQIRCTMYQAQISGDITSGSNQITNAVSRSLTMKVGQTIFGPGIPDGTTITAVTGTGNGYTVGSPGTITMSANATGTATTQNIYGVTSDGLKLIGVESLTVVLLDTARCVAGMRVVGGGGNGIRVMNHRSLSSDISPLVVQPGAAGTTPRVNVHADWRYHLGYSVDIASGLGAADIRLGGYVEGFHQGDGGSSGKYAARSASTSAVLDIAGLRQKNTSGLTGFINPATVTLVGKASARLGNEVPAKGVIYYADGSGGQTATAAGSSGQSLVFQSDGSLAPATPGAAVSVVAQNIAQVVVSNTVTETSLIAYTIPANSVLAGTSYRIQAGGSFDANTASTTTITFRVRIGGTGGTSLFPLAVSTQASTTGKAWKVDAELVFRAAASASTPVAATALATATVTSPIVVGGVAATNVNMTTARDLTLDSIWGAADANNVLRCEYAAIEKVA